MGVCLVEGFSKIALKKKKGQTRKTRADPEKLFLDISSGGGARD